MNSDNVFAKIDTVFCDSRDALEQAKSEGLTKEVIVKTIAPPLLLSGGSEYVNLEASLPQIRYVTFFKSGAAFAETIYHAVLADEILRPYALLLTRIAISQERYFLKAALLEDADFEAPRAVLNFDTGNAVANERMNSIWEKLLAPNDQLVVRRYPVTPTDERDTAGGRPPKLSDRIRFASWSSLFYRIFERAGRRLPDGLFRGKVVAMSEIETVKETGFHLGLRGFKLEHMKIKRTETTDAPISAGKSDALATVLEQHLADRAASIAHDKAVPTLVDQCLKDMRAAIERFDAAYALCPKILPHKTCAILTGYPDGPEVMAMARYTRESGIPFVAFQHGVDREITGMHDFNHAHLENSVAEYFVTYNDLSTELTNKSEFDGRLDGWKCKVAAAGLSQDQLKVESEQYYDPSIPPILYVSTAVYRGYFAYRTDANTDIGTAVEERDLVRQVLSQTPHDIAFKPYPALRFPDPDPVLEEVRSSGNVHLTGEFIDLRYLVRRHRVLIVTRATSTVGWCLMTRKPTIFVDVPHWFALRDEARKAFQVGTFFFDSTQENWMVEMRDLLSLPIEEIERQWREKAPARRELIEKFVDSRGPGAGKRAAKLLTNWITEARH